VLSRTLPFSPDQGEGFFQEIPARAAAFLLRGDGDPYVSKTTNLRRRLQRLLGPPAEPSKRLNLHDRVREIAFTPTGSDFESQFLLYRLLRETFPTTYAARLRLRPAPLVKLLWENEYPRASVTTRLSRFGGKNLYYGPFVSRDVAEQFSSDALDFFKMRRCVDDLHPDPAFPGCVYSEMKMCLAPCFKGCTDAEYGAEVARVQAFFDTAGESFAHELTEQRERASAALAFEEAAAIHAKLDKLRPLLSQLPEIVHRIDRLQALVIQTSSEPGGVALFRFRDLTLSGPVLFSVEPQAESRSMESRIEEALASFAAPQSSTAERIEHLAILKRWYYRSTRIGEIFLADDKGAWPLRRIVRGIGRVYKGEKPQEPTTFSATQNPSQPS
jgi:excinuclease ABC subunit C